MLALTHHVIVQYSALTCGINSFKDYAILGDDVVIANDIVAQSYVNIMAELGVSINMQKTIQSTDLIEFAKKWKGPSYDFTPIGPGLIIQACRSRFAIFNLLLKLKDMNIIKTIDTLNGLVKSLPRFFKIGKDDNMIKRFYY